MERRLLTQWDRRYKDECSLRRFCLEEVVPKAFQTQKPKWKAIVVDIEGGKAGRNRNRGTEVIRVEGTEIVPPEAG